jgi:hypothetical protein
MLAGAVCARAGGGDPGSEDWVNVPSRAFLAPQDRVIRLDSGRPEVCFQLEPINGSFDIHSFDFYHTRLLRDPGLQAVSKIPGLEATIDRDTDGNGIEEIRACFTKADLRQLLSDVRGHALVPIRVYGNPMLPSPLNWLEVHLSIEVVGDGSYRVRPLHDPNP